MSGSTWSLTEERQMAAGIVLYQPNVEYVKQNIVRLLRQVSKIYLIDNSDCDNHKSFSCFEDGVDYYSNRANCGIARALNQLFARAKKDGFEWMLTFDQDSFVESDYVYRLVESCPDDPKLAVICPIVRDQNSGEVTYETGYVKRCITSGSLNRIAAEESIGGFDEYMFIDYVDYDYCDRLLARGWTLYRNAGASLPHSVGKASIKTFFGVRIRVMNHSSARKYYQARNWIYWQKKRGAFSVSKSLLHSLEWAFIVIVWEEDKIKKLQAICKGTIEGLRFSQFVRTGRLN